LRTLELFFRAWLKSFETNSNELDIKVKGVVLCQQIKMIDFKEQGLLFTAKLQGKL
jgi:hypothetical protein